MNRSTRSADKSLAQPPASPPPANKLKRSAATLGQLTHSANAVQTASFTAKSNSDASMATEPLNVAQLLKNSAIIKLQSILRGIRVRRVVRSDSLLKAWAELDKAEENELIQTHKRYQLLKIEMAKKQREQIDAAELARANSLALTVITSPDNSSALQETKIAADSILAAPVAIKSRGSRSRSRSSSPVSEPPAATVKRVKRPSTPTDDDNTFSSLPDPINLDFVQKLLDHLKAGNKLPTRALQQLLTRIKPVLKEQPNIVQVNVPTRCTVVGDLHGQLPDLLEIFRLQGEPSDRNYFVFNGDFVDRGAKSCECIISLLAFKLLCPHAIHLNRGNHEDQGINSRDGFEKECLQKYNAKIFEEFSEVFSVLPLVTILNQAVFVVHGGLFSRPNVCLRDIEEIDRFQSSPPSNSLFEQLLWSDPQEKRGVAENSRGCGIQFGPDVTEKFLKQNHLQLIVRSHEWKDQGYELTHNGNLYTVFSASNYCGSVGNHGAVLVFEHNENQAEFAQPRIITYYTQKKTDWKFRLQSMENSVINKLIPRIADNRLALLQFYRNCEIQRQNKEKPAHNSPKKRKTVPSSAGPGSIATHINHVSRSEWAEGLRRVLSLNIPFLNFQNALGLPKLGLDGRDKGPIDYMEFLNRFLPFQIMSNNLRRTESDLKLPEELMPGKSLQSQWREHRETQAESAELSTEESLQNLLDMLYRNRFDLESLFRHFDVNGDESISVAEFKSGILALQHIVHTKFNEKEIDLLIKHIDTDQDGEISYEEFFTAFRQADTELNHRHNNSAQIIPITQP
jgi:serine/threonine-protein phosphatase 5